MFQNMAPITKAAHGSKKVRPIKNFDFVQEVNIASVMVHEFSRASATYPIVFLEDKENDRFRPVALMGFEQGENLFVSDGKWNASYIPAIIRRYPFALAQTGKDSRFTVCIDESSNLLNEEEGVELFNDKGEPSETMDKVKQYLAELQQMENFTSEFCSYMASNNMFTPLNMKIRVGKEVKSIAGAYVVNEERFNSLSDEKFLELRSKQYIPVVYAHLSSLSQIERLIGFKDKSAVTTEQIDDRFAEEKKSVEAKK